MGTGHGFFEANIRKQKSDFLELAISVGDFTPGARGWKGAQARIVREFLHRSSDEHGGRSPLEVITAGRVGAWAEGRSELRNAMLLPILDRLIEPVEVPGGLEVAL